VVLSVSEKDRVISPHCSQVVTFDFVATIQVLLILLCKN
jgi:hypothetical protein